MTTDTSTAEAAGRAAAREYRAAGPTMAVFGGPGVIPEWTSTGTPSRTRRAAGVVGGRVALATKAALYERLHRKHRTWLKLFLFGTSTPAGVTTRRGPTRKTTKRRTGGSTGWTPTKRSMAAKKGAAKRRRDRDGKFA